MDTVLKAKRLSCSKPVPEIPSTISKLLNMMDCGESKLLEALEVTYYLTDESISQGIKEQDRLIQEVMVMAAGISQKMPCTYNAAIKSEEYEMWREACKQ